VQARCERGKSRGCANAAKEQVFRCAKDDHPEDQAAA
jgi:hypothetical protein